MTLAHRYIENQFVRLSRGTLNGLPLLMPGKDDKLCNQIREIFSRDASRFDITILALNVEPYGYTAIVFDPNMRRSDLLKSVNQCISMKVKKSTGHRESLWSNRKPENVPILDLQSLENEVFEVCIAPLKKGYVARLSEWILPRIGPSNWPEHEEDENPKDQKEAKSTEAQVEKLSDFSLAKPLFNRGPGLLKCGVDHAVIEKLRLALLNRISEFQEAEMGRRKSASSTKTLGSVKCRLTSTYSKQSVRNWEEYTPSKRAAISASEELLHQAVLCLNAFYDAYRKALAKFIKTKIPKFPTGTLKMRTFFKLCASPSLKMDPFSFKYKR